MPLLRSFSLTLVLAVIALSTSCSDRDAASVPSKTNGNEAAGVTGLDASTLDAELRAQVANHRKIIVLLADESTMSPQERATTSAIGQRLFHENLERAARIDGQFATLLARAEPERFAAIAARLDYIESSPDLYDADRLAFQEVLSDLQTRVGKQGSLPAIKLHQRIGEDLAALDEIERNYDQEISRVFGRFDRTRAIELKRGKWNDYVAALRKIYDRDALLRDNGVITPYPMSMADGDREVFGHDLPPKTIVLTFDDGPHRSHTEEIVAILKRYDVPATFFQVGRNLGTLDSQGHATLGPLASVTRDLIAQGYTVGNHSLTHAQLSKESGDALRSQILYADTLLRDVDARRAPLFRFPYGARNAEGMKILGEAKLRSVMWNIDSLDWADPVPESIVQRVLDSVEKEQRGIVLFHDIHERTVKALPQVLDRLSAEGYRFASWNGRDFSVARDARKPEAAITTGYARSWAIVIGIDDYARWPKLRYAANDAGAIANTLIGQFGFPSSQVIVLKNQDATRNNILAAFHDRLGDLGKNDRVFVFFAGHGATRQLASGRDLGYIIPVDSDPDQFASDAIAMSDIQNIAESLQAKHVLFVMDACYSGLGLTRGGGTSAYLRENARRIARQMLTAGGADQEVADSGPNGHSVFTWVLLQALSGKGDLNGDGLITGTELAAYVAPAVSGIAPQTPAFGSLPGSQGGEFVFEVQAEDEYLTAGTQQLSSDAIAINHKAEAAAPVGESAVTLRDLQGGERSVALPAAAGKLSDRQQAQRANDRGLQLYKEKRYAEAEDAFTEALKLRPDFALAANNLGFVYYRQEKYAEAARWLENTLRIDPSRAVAYMNLGDAYRHLGDKPQAEKAYRTYLELQPRGTSADTVRQQLEQLK